LTRNIAGIPDGDTARSIHHRQPRRAGGRDSAINMVNLCIKCHKEIHADEENAAKDGWMILDRRFPGNVPFNSWRGWVLPDLDGSLRLMDFERGRLIDLTPAPASSTRRPRVATRQRHRSRQVKRLRRVA
jgi:hypothetical protein